MKETFFRMTLENENKNSRSRDIDSILVAGCLGQTMRKKVIYQDRGENAAKLTDPAKKKTQFRMTPEKS